MKRRSGPDRPRRKDLQYQELLEAVGERGCPICRRAEESVEDALSAILHEQVNDAGFREELLSSGGFCRQHAWRLVAHRDILGTAMLYRALLRDAGRHRQPRARCSLCRSYDRVQRSALDTFTQSLSDAAFVEKLAASDGLCDPHFEMALQGGGDERRLRQCQENARDRLLGQLDELIRKQDHRFMGEPDAGERDSWLRAVNATVGIDLKALPRRRSRKLPPAKPNSVEP